MKNLRILALLMAVMLLLAGCGKDYSEANARIEGMTAMEIAKDMGIGWNLGNTFDGHYASTKNKTGFSSEIGENLPENYETCWGSPITTEEMIQGVVDAGFNSIRVPVYWGNMMVDDGTFTVHPDFIDRVAEVVDMCLERDVYCVINMHHYDENLVRHLPQEEALRAVELVWTQVAEYFKDYPQTLLFEGFNEYVGIGLDGVRDTYDYANALNQTFVDSVRATGGNNVNRVLIASGYNTNIDATTKPDFLVPTDSVPDRMMVSVHYVDNGMYWSNQLGGQKWYDYSVSQLELLKEAFIDKGVPVYIGECTSRTSYSNAFDRFDKNPIFGDGFDLFEIEMGLIVDYGCIPVIWDTTNDWYLKDSCTLREARDGEIVKKIAERIAGTAE